MKGVKFVSPQTERDVQWQSSVSNASASIPSSGRDDLIIDREHESQVYVGELGRLRKENATLRESLQRALSELKAMQFKYPSAYTLSGEKPADYIPPWSTAPEIMSPLFEAYDSKIYDLEDQINQQASKLEEFPSKIAAILAENEALRQNQLESLRRNQHQDSSNPLSSEWMREQSERLDILMSENAMLVEQKALLNQQLDAAQSELQKRTREIDDLSDKLRFHVEELIKCQEKLQQVEADRDTAAKQAVGYCDALGKAENEIDILNEQLGSLKQRCRESESLGTELQDELKQLRVSSEEEAVEAMRRVKKAEDRVRELHAQLLTKTQELDNTQEVLRKLRLEFKSTRQDAEGMVQVMSGMERQISEYASREAEVQRLTRDCKEKVEEALSARDQAIVRDEQRLREVERLQEERKRMALKRQADIDAAVELARQRATDQLRSCEKDLEDMAERNAKLKAEAEKSVRESKSAQDMLDNIRRLQEDERRAAEQALRELSEKLNAAMIAKEEEAGRRNEVQETNKEYRGNIDRLRSQNDALRAQMAQQERIKETEVATLKASLRDLQREIADKSRLNAKLSRDLDDNREKFHERVAAVEKKFGEENSNFRRRALEADRMSRELEQTASEGDRRSHQLMDSLQEKTSAALKEAETQLRQESELVKNFSQRNRQLDHIIREMTAEKASLINVVEEARSTIDRLERELAATRVSAMDITGQLAHSYATREQSLHQATRAMDEFGGSHSVASPSGSSHQSWQRDNEIHDHSE